MSERANKPSKQLGPSPASSRVPVPQRVGSSGFGGAGGAPFSGGMGIPRAASRGLGQTTIPSRLTVPTGPSSAPGELQRHPLAPPAPVLAPAELQRHPRPETFTCSLVTAEFLRQAVLRDEDILLVDLTGSVAFDSTPGTHIIPLMQENDRLTAPGRAGAFYIGQGQALVITDFEAFATVPNVGLPGGNISIDPLALIGQVTFSLVSQGGAHPFNQQSSTPNSTSSGTSILYRPIRHGHPVVTATVKTGNVVAQYNVVNPPFPGFPRVVGASMKGYLLDANLLNQIQNQCFDGPVPLPVLIG